MYNRGYRVKVDGKYGFINNEGEWILENVYDESISEPLVEEVNITSLLRFNSDPYVTYIENELGLAQYQYGDNPLIDYPDNNYVTIRWFSDGAYELFWYNMRTYERVDFGKLHDPSQPEYYDILSYLKDYRDNMLIIHPTDQFGRIDHDIYYAVTKEGKAFGPFYSRLPLCKSTNTMERGENTVVKGLFVNSTENGYQVLDEKGNVVEEEYFDYAEFISYDAVKVTKEGQIGIVNRDGLVYLGEFEDVSNCIDGNAYVKKDGIWQLIRINDE